MSSSCTCFDFTHNPAGTELQLRLRPAGRIQLMSQAGIRAFRTDWHASAYVCAKVRSPRVIQVRKICHIRSFYMACWKCTISTCMKRFIPGPWQFVLTRNVSIPQKPMFCLFEVPGNFSDFSDFSCPCLLTGSLLKHKNWNKKGQEKGKKRIHFKETLEACLLQYTTGLQNAHWKPPPSRKKAWTWGMHTLWGLSFPGWI